MDETKPDLRCLIEELHDPQILPEGWVLLRRTPNSDPADGFAEIKLLGVGADPLAELEQAEDERQKYSDKYHALLVGVVSKHAGETRHETALRYIREREQKTSGPASLRDD